MQVHLSENVFIGLVLSSVEVYKKECFGLLLGYRAFNKYIVEHAIPYQSVKRGHKWAELRTDKWRIIREVLQNFPKLDVIGDFHSHTMYRWIKADTALSDDDINNMEANEVQIVIAVNENKKSQSWGVNSDNTVSGTINGYHFKIAAYYFPEDGNKEKKPVLAEILCPFAMGYK